MKPIVQATVACLTFITATVSAQTAAPCWHLKIKVGVISPNGEFFTTRANGKQVTTDIDAGPGLDVRVERKLSRRFGVRLGYLGLSQHEIVFHQDFPDGTEFTSSDKFSFHSLNAGLAVYLVSAQKLEISVDLLLSYANYDDILIPNAGPPFDRTTPLDIDVQNNLGGGLIVNFDFPFATSRWNAGVSLGLLVQRFQGTFATEDDPDPVSDIDLDFNPLILMAGIGYAF